MNKSLPELQQLCINTFEKCNVTPIQKDLIQESINPILIELSKTRKDNDEKIRKLARLIRVTVDCVIKTNKKVYVTIK